MLRNLSAAISQSWISLLIQDHVWVVPAVQSIHILAIASLIFASFSANFTILRGAGAARDTLWLAGSYRWTWASLAVLLVSGTILLVGEPTRSIMNVFFRVKVVLVIVSALLTLVVQRALSGSGTGTGTGRLALVSLAGISVLLWVAIMFCGRFIAYFGEIAE